MNIPINKDFERNYKDTVWKGFSLKELKCVALAAAAAIIAVLFFWLGFGLPMEAAIYLGVPFAAPVIFSGFIKYENGLGPKENRAAQRYRRATARLAYQSGEYDSALCSTWQKEQEYKPDSVTKQQKKAYRKYIRNCLREQKRAEKRERKMEQKRQKEERMLPKGVSEEFYNEQTAGGAVPALETLQPSTAGERTAQELFRLNELYQKGRIDAAYYERQYAMLSGKQKGGETDEL